MNTDGASDRGDPISILIVDDHALVRHGARAFLEVQPDFVVVGEVGSAIWPN